MLSTGGAVIDIQPGKADESTAAEVLRNLKVLYGTVAGEQALDREFPGLREKYEKRYGTRYRCTVPGAAKLYAWVREECSRLGLLSEMEAIIAVSRRGYDFGGLPGHASLFS